MMKHFTKKASHGDKRDIGGGLALLFILRVRCHGLSLPAAKNFEVKVSRSPSADS